MMVAKIKIIIWLVGWLVVHHSTFDAFFSWTSNSILYCTGFFPFQNFEWSNYDDEKIVMRDKPLHIYIGREKKRVWYGMCSVKKRRENKKKRRKLWWMIVNRKLDITRSFPTHICEGIRKQRQNHSGNVDDQYTFFKKKNITRPDVDEVKRKNHPR